MTSVTRSQLYDHVAKSVLCSSRSSPNELQTAVPAYIFLCLLSGSPSYACHTCAPLPSAAESASATKYVMRADQFPPLFSISICKPSFCCISDMICCNNEVRISKLGAMIPIPYLCILNNSNNNNLHFRTQTRDYLSPRIRAVFFFLNFAQWT